MKIDEMRDNRNINKLNGKDREFLISPKLLNLRTNNYSGINLNKILRRSSNRREFDNIIAYELFKNIEVTEFFDFSLIMGLNFGVYNPYGFMPLSSELKERVLRSNPNIDDTLFILNNYKKELDYLFKEKYNLDSIDLTMIIKKMLKICDNNDLYNNDLIKDIGKTILAVKMRYGSYDVDLNSMKSVEVRDYIRTGKAIEYFDYINNKNKKTNFNK